MLIDCRCGATCRVPSLPKGRVCCGKCKHEFTPAELVKTRPEPAPSLQEDDWNEDEDWDE